MNGYQPQRVSTHAIEFAIGQYANISDAIAFGYQQEGHEFYELTFPTGNATWVLDLTAMAAAGYPVWHERGAFSNGQLSRDIANCCVYFNGKMLVGDYANGNIYSYDLGVYTDNGAPIKRLRSWRASPVDRTAPTRFNALEIMCQTGINVPVNLNPQGVLRWSDDGGQTWSYEKFCSLGQQGETGRRVRFNRLGSTKRGQGLDRIFEFSTTDAVPVAWIGADLT